MRYRLFGFTLDSDVRFPELQSAAAGAPPALWLRAEPSPAPIGRIRPIREIEADDGEPWLSIGRAADTYVLDFRGRVLLRHRTPHVWWTRHAALADDSFRHLLLDQALPLVVSHEGRAVLHGASAVADGHAVLFAGPAGSGKSTLVASLLANGWQAAADDAALIECDGGMVTARPSYPGLRLWPDASAALGYGQGGPVAERSGKRRFSRGALPDDALRLRAIYVLKTEEPHAPPGVNILSRRDAVMELVRNAYVLDVENRAQARSRLETFAAIAARIPVLQLAVPHSFDALPRVADIVARDLTTGAPA